MSEKGECKATEEAKYNAIEWFQGYAERVQLNRDIDTPDGRLYSIRSVPIGVKGMLTSLVEYGNSITKINRRSPNEVTAVVFEGSFDMSSLTPDNVNMIQEFAGMIEGEQA